MSTAESHADKSLRRQLLLPTLILSMFSLYASVVFVGTLLVDIASSFKVSIGTAILLALVSSIAGLIVGLALSALTIRFKLKSLFLLGLALGVVGTLIFFFAPNFAIALLAPVFGGTGGAIIGSMVFSLIGENFPLEKRGGAVGAAVAMVFFAFVFVAPLSGYIMSVAGWRSFLLFFSLPLSLVCLALGLFAIPSKPRQEQPPPRSLYSEALKKIFSNKSAVACLVSATLVAFFSSVPTYAVSFYRIHYSVVPMIGGAFSAVAAVGGFFGAAGGGRLINRYGRKTLAVAAALVGGIFAILFTFVPNMWVSVVFWAASASSAGLVVAALTSLVLEQVPEFRASIMSMHTTFGNVGAVLGIILGNLVLNLYANNFQILMPTFGASGVASALIVFLLARDPSKTQLPRQSTA